MHKQQTDMRKIQRILLYGPSGCGKTALAQAFAQEIGTECIVVNSPALGNEYQNSTISNLRRIIESAIASNHPCVIVLNKMNVLMRESNNPRIDNNIALGLAGLLDAVERHPHIIICGITHTVDRMSPLLRSRFLGGLVTFDNSYSNNYKSIISYFLNFFKTETEIKIPTKSAAASLVMYKKNPAI